MRFFFHLQIKICSATALLLLTSGRFNVLTPCCISLNRCDNLLLHWLLLLVARCCIASLHWGLRIERELRLLLWIGHHRRSGCQGWLHHGSDHHGIAYWQSLLLHSGCSCVALSRIAGSG